MVLQDTTVVSTLDYEILPGISRVVLVSLQESSLGSNSSKTTLHPPTKLTNVPKNFRTRSIAGSSPRCIE